MPKLVIRKHGADNLRGYCAATTDKALGAQIGVHRSQVTRVFTGHHDAGNKFIAGVIARCGLEFAFSKVFEIRGTE